jgi:hypothetical protein
MELFLHGWRSADCFATVPIGPISTDVPRPMLI